MKKDHLIGIFLLFSIFILLAVPTRAETSKLSPVDDAYVDSYYRNDNYGASDYLEIGNILWGGYCVTYLKFQIPTTDKVVRSAKVSTYWYNFMCYTWLTVRAGTTDTNWNEKTITYANSPHVYYDLLAEASISDGDHFEFDVTDYIPESGAFAIIIWEESNTGESLQGDSKENDFLTPDPPYLSIKYKTTIEDLLPAIIGGIVAIVAVGAFVGFRLHYMNKRRTQRRGLVEDKVEKLEEKGILFCPKCNQPIDKGAHFCSNCGNQL